MHSAMKPQDPFNLIHCTGVHALALYVKDFFYMLNLNQILPSVFSDHRLNQATEPGGYRTKFRMLDLLHKIFQSLEGTARNYEFSRSKKF